MKRRRAHFVQRATPAASQYSPQCAVDVEIKVRIKIGTPATHPLTGREMRALRKHQPASPGAPGAFVFVSERSAPLSAPGFSRMVERAGRAVKVGIKVHAHMLRHACGYALANAGHDTRAQQTYLGHHNIQNTTRYTALAHDRFARFWQD